MDEYGDVGEGFYVCRSLERERERVVGSMNGKVGPIWALSPCAGSPHIEPQPVKDSCRSMLK